MTHANDANPNAAQPARTTRAPRKPRYQQIADTLREEIRRGDHAIGHFLASEAELKARFRVSRHTVRDALRVLDELGLIVRRRGAGSVVRNAEVHRHFDQALHSIADLLQYDESSDFHARYTDRLVANQELAGWLQTRLGTECILLHGVRIGRRTRRPIASVYVYRRASWHGLPSRSCAPGGRDPRAARGSVPRARRPRRAGAERDRDAGGGRGRSRGCRRARRRCAACAAISMRAIG